MTNFLSSLRIALAPIFIMCFSVAAFAQEAPSGEGTSSQLILKGFVPDVEQLDKIPGKYLKKLYHGKRIKGIYQSDRHEEGQLYTERFNEDGTIDYSGGDFTSSGKWYVSGDKLCFEYDAIEGSRYCYYEYEYGDCIISFSDETYFFNGKPFFPSHWNSVVRVTDDDFKWEEQTGDAARDFVCQRLLG